MKLLRNVGSRVWLGLILLLLSLVVALADGHSEKDKIADVLRRYESLVNQSYANGVGSLYVDDAILIPDRFAAFSGKAAITGF